MREYAHENAVEEEVEAVGEEMLLGEDIYSFADASLEIILKFDDDGHILYANSLAKEELGYGEALSEVNLEKLFPAELHMEEGSSTLDAVRKMTEGMMYRKNGTCFPVRMAVKVKGGQSLLFAINIAKRVETERKDRKSVV